MRPDAALPHRPAPNRTLCGYSHGGLFGTYALFHRPGLFQSYILESPSYGWAEGAATPVARGWPHAMVKGVKAVLGEGKRVEVRASRARGRGALPPR